MVRRPRARDRPRAAGERPQAPGRRAARARRSGCRHLRRGREDGGARRRRCGGRLPVRAGTGPRATTPCSRAATRTSTRSSSSARRGSCGATASWGCSCRPASRRTRARRRSSAASAPRGGSARCSTLRTGARPWIWSRSSPTWIAASSSAPSIFGGRERRFAQAECAFFQQSAAAAETAAFALTPEDFALVNPNTGTAPVFRTPRDAEITRGIYRRLPVLVDRRDAQPRALWPVRYATHVPYDQRQRPVPHRGGAGEGRRLPRRRAAMGERGGAMGAAVWRASFNLFDHRAASVTVNPANVHNPFLSEPTTPDAACRPGLRAPAAVLGRGDKPGLASWPGMGPHLQDIARPTDARTVIAALGPAQRFRQHGAAATAGSSRPTLTCYQTDHATARGEHGRARPWTMSLARRSKARTSTSTSSSNFPSSRPTPSPGASAPRPPSRSSARTCCASPTSRTTWKPSRATRATRGRPSPGTRRTGCAAGHGSTRSSSTSTAWTATPPPTCSARSPSSSARSGSAAGRFRSRDLILGYMAALAADNPDASVAG